jgi:hypothetical protein
MSPLRAEVFGVVAARPGARAGVGIIGDLSGLRATVEGKRVMATRRTQKPNSIAVGAIDPGAALVSAVLCQSLEDLRSHDPVKAVDALLFWVDDTCGASVWLDYLGLGDPGRVLSGVLSHATRKGQKKHTIS